MNHILEHYLELYTNEIDYAYNSSIETLKELYLEDKIDDFNERFKKYVMEDFNWKNPTDGILEGIYRCLKGIIQCEYPELKVEYTTKLPHNCFNISDICYILWLKNRVKDGMDRETIINSIKSGMIFHMPLDFEHEEEFIDNINIDKYREMVKAYQYGYGFDYRDYVQVNELNNIIYHVFRDDTILVIPKKGI